MTSGTVVLSGCTYRVLRLIFLDECIAAHKVTAIPVTVMYCFSLFSSCYATADIALHKPMYK